MGGYISTVRAPLSQNSYVARIDHDFNEKNRFFATYRYSTVTSLTTAHGSQLVPLTPSEAIKLSATDAAQIRGPAISTQQGAARTSSYALAMCRLSEGPENGDSTFQTSMEWQTAAAHAILTSAGKRVCDCESERELGYNKKTLSNSSIKVT